MGLCVPQSGISALRLTSAALQRLCDALQVLQIYITCDLAMFLPLRQRGGTANLFSSITQPPPTVPGFRPDTRKPGHQPDAADVPVVSIFCCNPVNGELRGQWGLLALAQHDALYRFHQVHGVGTVDERHTLAIHRGQAEGTVIAGDLDGNGGEVLVVQM